MSRLMMAGLAAGVLAVMSPRLAAQNPPAAPPSTLAMHAQLVSQYRAVQRVLKSAAELMPEAEYAFRPTPAMRPFIANIGHAANANYGYCANLSKAEAPAAYKDIEKSLKTKADALQALADSVAFCEPFMKSVTAETLSETYTATAQTPDGAPRKIEISKGGLLSAFIAHQNEVYGYTAVYLRLKNLVPPSSTPPAGRGRGGF